MAPGVEWNGLNGQRRTVNGSSGPCRQPSVLPSFRLSVFPSFRRSRLSKKRRRAGEPIHAPGLLNDAPRQLQRRERVERRVHRRAAGPDQLLHPPGAAPERVDDLTREARSPGRRAAQARRRRHVAPDALGIVGQEVVQLEQPAGASAGRPRAGSGGLPPAEHGLVICPGTASTSRPRSSAHATVWSAPEVRAASTTTTTRESPLMRRFRRGKLPAVGRSPGGNSVRRSPSRATRSYSSRFAAGYTTPSPFPSTPIVAPFPSSAPACATASSPRAIPLTTASPASAAVRATARHTSAP